MKILDKYIIKKFLGTFFFSLALILSVVVVWDITEKLEDFIQKQAPLKAIIVDYYFNFVPYFASLLAPLFIFIAVIYFTARLANNTEIVAILCSGISFRRLLVPYLVAATFLASLSFYFQGWVIPHSNKIRLEFENVYIRNKFVFSGRNFHRQISPGEFFYMESYNNLQNIGYRFTYEKFTEGKLTYKLASERISWDSLSHQWILDNYSIRLLQDSSETLVKGVKMDSTFAFSPEDFSKRIENIETMDNGELDAFIQREASRGSENIDFYKVEKYGRFANPFATFILTLIGVSLASRKVRGGIGMQIVFGLVLSFTYIFMMQISNTFALYGGLPVSIAVWIPNLVYAVIALVLLRKAPK